MRDILYIKDGREYFYNADGKIVSQPVDNSVDYRRSELPPEINKALDRARQKGNYPSRSLINALVDMQEYSELKALNYVKYKLLGEARYLDVFGEAAESRFEAQRHYKKTEEMEFRLLEMSATINDMQKLIFNIATTLNQSHREEIKYRRTV